MKNKKIKVLLISGVALGVVFLVYYLSVKKASDKTTVIL